MNFDGYMNFEPNRLEKFKEYSLSQKNINLRLKEIALEISILPKIPHSIDEWISSWSDTKSKNFGIDTYNKHMKISKEYNQLVDLSEDNLREMKIIFIEDIIEKINDTLNKTG